MSLPGATAAPAVDARRARLAEATGAAAVRLVEEDRGAHEFLTAESLENAVRVLMAIGGSTNAVVHLSALARRLGIELPLERFDEISSQTPLLSRVKPVGDHTLQSYFEAGGTQTVMRELAPALALNTPHRGRPVAARAGGRSALRRRRRDRHGPGSGGPRGVFRCCTAPSPPGEPS